MKFTFSLLICLCTLSLSAQNQDVNANIREAFGHYQASFLDANKCQANIVGTLKNAMSEDEIKISSGKAKDLALSAKVAAETAAEEVKEAFDASMDMNCKAGSSILESAYEAFHEAKSNFNVAEDQLRQIAIISDLDDVADLYISSSNSIRLGVEQLNSAVQKINGGMSKIKSCK